MSYFTDLFNPTFLIILGIIVLAIAVLIVYYESKMRSQNHKIASMLSLVSTLAEDMNSVKMGMNQIAMGRGSNATGLSNVTGGTNTSGTGTENSHHLGSAGVKSLIDVSDDEESDDEESDHEEGGGEYDDHETETEHEGSDGNEIDYESDDETDDETDNDDEESHTNIKVLKLSILENDDDDVLESQVDLCDMETSLNDCEMEHLEDLDESPEVADEYVEEVLDLDYSHLDGEKEGVEQPDEETSEKESESQSNSPTHLKTISIDLGETTSIDLGESATYDQMIDYKKLQINKLRSIAVEKGLVNSADASKLKKQEILKMFGCE